MDTAEATLTLPQRRTDAPASLAPVAVPAPVAVARTRRRRPHASAGAIATPVGLLAAVFGLWWLLAHAVVADPVLLPTPKAVAERFAALLGDGSAQGLGAQVGASLQRIAVGWTIAVVGGVLTGLAIASSRVVDRIASPVLEFSQPVPPLAFAPLLAVWFGIGELPKVLIVAFGGFGSVVIATVAAVRAVDESWRRSALSLGSSRLHLARHVILPGALPGILAAMRIANLLCWSTLVAAEILGSERGVGYMILTASRFLQTPTIFVGILTIGTLALCMDLAIQAVQRRLTPWSGRALA